jgi:hypothetical protein
MWNIDIAEMSHNQQAFFTSVIKRLDAYNKDTRAIEIIVVVIWRRNRES